MIIYYDDVLRLKYELGQRYPQSTSNPELHFIEELADIDYFLDSSEDIFAGETEESSIHILEVSDLSIDEIKQLRPSANIVYCVSLLSQKKPLKSLKESFISQGLEYTVYEGYDQSIAASIAHSYTSDISIQLEHRELQMIVSHAQSYQQLIHIIDAYTLSDKDTSVYTWFKPEVQPELFKLQFPQDIQVWAQSNPDQYQMNLALASTKAKKNYRSKQIQSLLIQTDESLKSDQYNEAWWMYYMWSIQNI